MIQKCAKTVLMSYIYKSTKYKKASLLEFSLRLILSFNYNPNLILIKFRGNLFSSNQNQTKFHTPEDVQQAADSDEIKHRISIVEETQVDPTSQREFDKGLK